MSQWNETANGNFVYVIEKDNLMTVFKRKSDDGWGGVYDGSFLKGEFDTPEEAQKAMEEFVFEGNDNLASKPIQLNTWLKTKKGGYYKTSEDGTISIKKASSGKWCIVSSKLGLIENQWFDTAMEAKEKADQLTCV